jgi:hypothetical protein
MQRRHCYIRLPPLLQGPPVVARMLHAATAVSIYVCRRCYKVRPRQPFLLETMVRTTPVGGLALLRMSAMLLPMEVVLLRGVSSL